MDDRGASCTKPILSHGQSHQIVPNARGTLVESQQEDGRTSDDAICPAKSLSPIITRLSTSPLAVECAKTVSVDTATIPYYGDFPKCAAPEATFKAPDPTRSAEFGDMAKMKLYSPIDFLPDSRLVVTDTSMQWSGNQYGYSAQISYGSCWVPVD